MVEKHLQEITQFAEKSNSNCILTKKMETPTWRINSNFDFETSAASVLFTRSMLFIEHKDFVLAKHLGNVIDITEKLLIDYHSPHDN